MNREYVHEELIELGVASVDTKGNGVISSDNEGGELPALGLSDD
ncbi:benenodin family lasso peptide [Sphingosinicella sp. CPCC 101087]|nr:benenodin family lasso peptide [Sphingosinicella sp. CPCC 101087]